MLLEAAGAVLGCGAAVRGLFWFVTRKIRHIATGAQRRALCPPHDHTTATGGCKCDLEGVKLRREILSLRSGAQAFGQIVAPADRQPSCILVFLHGYTSHSDLYLEDACVLARQGFTVLLPDLPGHGRTDGLLTHVPEWFAWVEEVWEIVELFLPLAQETGNGRPLKVFLGGVSLGGGLAACMCVQRPAFFQGVVLVAPMLFVSDEVKPPKVVQHFFKWFLVPLLPLWPITPVKSLDHLDFRVPSQGHTFGPANPMGMKGLKARLISALQFGFVFPDWMETQLKNFKTPVLIQHGDHDFITEPELSRRLHREAATADKTLKIYEGAYHCELLSCLPGLSHNVGGAWLPEQSATTQRCLGDMAEWLAARA
mmetsp:Transcript_76946/g.238323  ORF Transcript_76946/g.238323 Transcript_76946/m.238323 type:complete len:369 (+) Transcript_76946:99-1205(+)